MQSVHKIPTIIVLSFLFPAKKKESLKYIVLNTHTYTDTLPHSFDQKSIIPLKVQTSCLNSKVSFDLLLG